METEQNDECDCGNPLERGRSQCGACCAEDADAEHGDQLADAESDELGGEA